MRWLTSAILLLVWLTLAAQTEGLRPELRFRFVEKDVEGTIGDLRSESVIDAAHFELSQLRGSVSLESLKTGNFLRDWHLMSEKYFHRQLQDRLYFASTAIGPEGNGYRIQGNLNIKGIERPVDFQAVVENGLLRITGTLNTADWDIWVMKSRPQNTVEVDLTLPLNQL